MEIRAARIDAEREMYKESAAICRTSGLSVTIRLIAWETPSTISLTQVHPDLYNHCIANLIMGWFSIENCAGISYLKPMGNHFNFHISRCARQAFMCVF